MMREVLVEPLSACKAPIGTYSAMTHQPDTDSANAVEMLTEALKLSLSACVCLLPDSHCEATSSSSMFPSADAVMRLAVGRILETGKLLLKFVCMCMCVCSKKEEQKRIVLLHFELECSDLSAMRSVRWLVAEL